MLNEQKSENPLKKSEILSPEELNALFGSGPFPPPKKEETPSNKEENMASEILSQDEVMNILSMMAGDKPSPKSETTPPKRKKRRDPFRINRVDKSRMKTLHVIHEGVARKFAAKVSSMIPCFLEAKLTAVDQMSYSEFTFGLDNPSYYNLLSIETPAKLDNGISYSKFLGHIALDINTSICYPLIDRLLGGGREPALSARRPLTTIELALIKQVTYKFLTELQAAWKKTIQLNFSIVQTESNQQIIQQFAPNELMVILCFEVSTFESRGGLSIAMPVTVLDQILPVEKKEKKKK